MNTTRPFFKELKELRESRGISIEEITERTKINPRYFEAIENGDFAVLPNVYMRLFLRSYAIEIGAEAEKALEDYEVFTTGKVQEKAEVKPKPVPREETLDDENFLNKLLTPEFGRRAFWGVVIIIAAFFVFKLAVGLLQEQRAEIEPDAVAVEQTEPNADQPDPESGNMDAAGSSEIAESNMPVPLPTSQEMSGGVVFAYEKYEGSSSYRLPIDPPFSFEIESLDRTRLNISTPQSVLFQGIMEANTREEYAFEDTLQFDFWSASHVKVRINDIDLTTQLTRSDKAVRASIIEDGSLSIQFYSH